MSKHDTAIDPKSQNTLFETSQRLQKAYQASRKKWAKAVGRPYDGDTDHRPPPGELDAEADE
ncbi:MAG: hypothetical protein JO111_01370 [Caulobacteraceae bacterium]|nr:hypothetical protein [Caulobacteraceae bacterium]